MSPCKEHIWEVYYEDDSAIKYRCKNCNYVALVSKTMLNILNFWDNIKRNQKGVNDEQS